MDCNQVYGEDEEGTDESQEGYNEEEECYDLAALAEVVCRSLARRAILQEFAASLLQRPVRALGKREAKATKAAGS